MIECGPARSLSSDLQCSPEAIIFRNDSKPRDRDNPRLGDLIRGVALRISSVEVASRLTKV